MSSSKKIDLYVKRLSGTCLSEPYIPPPPYTLYACIHHTYSHRDGGGGVNQREGEKGNSSQSWVENTVMTDCISSL